MVDVGDENARWRSACELLARPHATYGALDERGTYAPMPPELAVLVSGSTGPRRIGRTGLDLVAPGDREAIMACFDRVRRDGAASTVMHLLGAEEAAWTMHMLDLRSRCGVYLAVSVPASDDVAPPTPVETPPPPPPRLARTRKDQGALIVGVDDAFTELLGWSADEVVGHRSSEYVHPDDQDLAISSWLEMLGSPGLSRRTRLRHLHKDGSWVWFELTNNNLLEQQGQVLCDMVDISDEMAAVDALRAREQLLVRLAEALPVGVVQTDADGALRYVNTRTADLFGARATHVDHLVAGLRGGGDADRLRAAFGAVLAGDPGAEAEVCLADGRTHLSVVLRRLDEAGVTTGAVACFTDVSDNLRLRDELRRRAEIDPLTGSLNRGAVLERLTAAVGAEGPGVAVVFVDLDGFKAVNDQHGHESGDELLVQVASVLREHCREHDVVGRYGGDEFLVTCERVGSSDEAHVVARRFKAALERHGLGASVGVAWSPPGRQDVRRLVAAADAAMYAAKATRDGRVVLAS